MLEAFKLGFAAGLGVFAAAITGLAVLGVWDWLGGVITLIMIDRAFPRENRGPTL